MISQTQFFLERYEYYRDKLLAYNMDTPIEKIGDLTDIFSEARVYRNEWTSEGVRFWRSSDVLVTIHKAIDASPGLRSKKALIENFIAGVNDVDDL